MKQTQTGGAVFASLPTRWMALTGLAALAMVAAVATGAGVGAVRIAILLLAAPLIEEAVFRLGLHETLLQRGFPPALANAATAAAFGLAHAVIRGDAWALLVALPALLIGAVYQRTRRLWHCVTLHSAMNAVWLATGIAGALRIATE